MDFILEFFLPRDCKDDEEQKQIRSSIVSMIQHVSRSLHLIEDEEPADQAASFWVKETGTRDESWISDMLEAQQRGENVIVSMGCHKDEPEEEFQVINQLYDHGFTYSEPENETYLEWGSKSRTRSRSKQKSRVKTDRNISLQVLQQYFHGSLKDAAKSIGVCPTTLKRICRQHGIMRWPSRKIKKVTHSLKKLQLVIDSVQGAEGMIQLGSFYTNFPEPSSPIKPTPRPKAHDRVNLLKSQTTPSNSSSSCSHGSSSTLKSQKRQCSNSSFSKNLLQDSTKLLVRSEINELVETMAPDQPKNSSPISSQVDDEGVFRVKASYGQEKIRFRMSKQCGFGELQHEITSRFNIYDMGDLTLEYIDDDSEWVLLTCDADLEECMDLHISTKNQTIRLFLHQSSYPAFVPVVHPNDGIDIW